MKDDVSETPWPLVRERTIPTERPLKDDVFWDKWRRMLCFKPVQQHPLGGNEGTDTEFGLTVQACFEGFDPEDSNYVCKCLLEYNIAWLLEETQDVTILLCYLRKIFRFFNSPGLYIGDQIVCKRTCFF
jgi:hypothetical protein